VGGRNKTGRVFRAPNSGGNSTGDSQIFETGFSIYDKPF
jgi:hypothetical protein